MINEKLFGQIGSLDLSIRCTNTLCALGIERVGDLIQKDDAYFLKSRNFQRRFLKEIREQLAKHGFSLGTRIENWPELVTRWAAGERDLQCAVKTAPVPTLVVRVEAIEKRAIAMDLEIFTRAQQYADTQARGLLDRVVTIDANIAALSAERELVVAALRAAGRVVPQ